MTRSRPSVYTIGHGTRTLEEFLGILKVYDINKLIDIRSIPRSHHNPQFNFDTFPSFLRNHDIGYHHMKSLGGLRHAKKDSINTGWRNASFRGFADYMQTEEFQQGLNELIAIANEKILVIMCSETLPWRCHRSLIGDALLVRDIKVIDIFSEHSAKEHTPTPWAKIENGKIIYPG